jgi:Uma2 family endonuclease
MTIPARGLMTAEDLLIHPDGRYGELVEAGYVLSRNPDTVRGPDVSFVSAARLGPGQIPKAFFTGGPDLAVEILSPSDSPVEVQEKVADYLRAGARLVWIVNPDPGSITVHHPSRSPQVLSCPDLLDGEDVVPGFQCPVSELFG